MIDRRGRLLLAAALSAVPTAAEAAEPYYFNKAGVSRETYVADVGECTELAGGVRVQRQYMYTPNMYAAAAAGLFSGLMQGAERRRLHDAVERTCMADKGYRRLTVAKDMLKSLKELRDEARLARLLELAASPSPVGKVLPE
jgi:hypothetical protein